MNLIDEKFWQVVSELITEQFGRGHPKTWKKPDIDAFRDQFHEKLEAICQKDFEKAELCGVPPVKGEVNSGPTLTYFSFRRIFLKGESAGRPSTKEMFAIYLGFDSVDDLMRKKGLYEEVQTIQENGLGKEKEEQVTEPPQRFSGESSDKKKRRWLVVFFVFLIGLVGAYLTWKSWHPNLSKTKCLIVRNDKGIAITDLNGRHIVQLIPDCQNLTGFDFDPNDRLLIWSNTNSNYRSIARAYLNESLDGIEELTLNNRFIELEYPCGITLDTDKRLIYCADYLGKALVAYTYEGELVSASLTDTIYGKPSAIELDRKHQVIYWTDVEKNWIGRHDLTTGETEHQFLTQVGEYPDGLSIDTLHQRLYWASNQSKQIGWTDLNKSEPHLITLAESPTAVEIDAYQDILYYSARNGRFVKQLQVIEGAVEDRPMGKHPLWVGSASPGVIKVYDPDH